MSDAPLTAEELDAMQSRGWRLSLQEQARLIAQARLAADAEPRPVTCLNARCSFHSQHNTCGAPDLLSITTGGTCNMWAYQQDDTEAARHAKEQSDAE